MPDPRIPSAFQSLRADIQRIEAGGRARREVLPFGVAPIDGHLPEGGLRLGALHEVAGGSAGAVDGAVAALFVAGIAARAQGPVLWCLARRDLFAPAIDQAGLAPDRVIYGEMDDDKAILAAAEEGLRHGGFAVVIGEIARLSMTASRRLQLAAEGGTTLAIALRRWRRQTDAADLGQPTAAITRWRVTALPSASLPVAGVGRPRWLVELIRCKAGDCADFELEACDETGRLALPADLVHRSPAPPARGRRAAG